MYVFPQLTENSEPEKKHRKLKVAKILAMISVAILANTMTFGIINTFWFHREMPWQITSIFSAILMSYVFYSAFYILNIKEKRDAEIKKDS